MNELEGIRELWLGFDQKLERNWKLNMELLKRGNLDKARSKMINLIWVKAIALAFYTSAMFFFLYFAISNWAVMHMAGAGFLLATWALSIIVASIHELDLISKIDFSEPVTASQKKLHQLRLTSIKYIRLGVWIAPLYFTFIILMFKLLWNIDIVAVGDSSWIQANIAFSILLVPAAIWAHRKLRAKNAEKKWMNRLLAGNGSQINGALSFIAEIKEFEKEEK